jgi:hypothetical protein
MRQRLALCLSMAVMAAAVLSGGREPAAQAACRPYKVNVPILQVRKDPKTAGVYVGALTSAETACVTNAPLVGPNGFVLHKTAAGGPPIPVGGWANLNFMSPLENAAPQDSGAMTSATTQEEPDGDTTLQSAQAILRFDQPIPYGATQVRGKTIKELAEGTPLFPPIEGLPDEVWQKPCTSCHKWTSQALCEQGKSYIPRAAEVFRHTHPYGGAYKLSLMRWAATGCK